MSTNNTKTMTPSGVTQGKPQWVKEWKNVSFEVAVENKEATWTLNLTKIDLTDKNKIKGLVWDVVNRRKLVVTAITLEGNQRVNKKALKILSQIPGVTTLSVAGCNWVTRDNLSQVLGFENLIGLSLSGCERLDSLMDIWMKIKVVFVCEGIPQCEIDSIFKMLDPSAIQVVGLSRSTVVPRPPGGFSGIDDWDVMQTDKTTFLDLVKEVEDAR